MNKPNPTIARLDRSARRAGLLLTERGVNKRELTLPDGSRILSYKPGGKGVVRVESLIWKRQAWRVDSIAHRTVPQMEALFARLTAEEAQ